MEWLSFINSEVHKGFSRCSGQEAPEDTQAIRAQDLVTASIPGACAGVEELPDGRTVSPSPTPTCFIRA